MLKIHLDDSTHMASRSIEIINRHVDWLCDLLDGCDTPPGGARILDVGCGPGLYCHELARRGHTALGFDIAPAPLRYARETAAAQGLDCSFANADLEALDLAGFVEEGSLDAITFWFGEFQSFPPPVVRTFLPRLAALLRPGGIFVLEYQHWDSYPREDIQQWDACDSSPFLDAPQLWLQEYHWDEEQQAEINIHWIIEAATGDHRRYAQCSRAWRDEALADLFAEAGLSTPVFLPPITGCDDRFEFDMMTTRRP